MSSMPVSMTPTVTGACAIGTAAASAALIAWAPQLTTSSGLSASVALCPRMEDGPPDWVPDWAPDCAPDWAGLASPGCGAGCGSGAAWRSPSGTAATRVGPTECTEIPAFARAAARSGANEADSLWAKNVPSSG